MLKDLKTSSPKKSKRNSLHLIILDFEVLNFDLQQTNIKKYNDQENRKI
jgi:hypothetical protein